MQQKWASYLLLIFTLTGASACSNKAIYDNIKHNQCLEKTGNIYCDDIEEYKEYQKKRDELLQEK